MAAISNLASARKPHRIAVAYPRRENASAHDLASHDALTQKLASVLQLRFTRDFQPDNATQVGGIYYVPAQTLVRSKRGDQGPAFLQELSSEADFFGGIVPYELVATKAISHSLLHADALAPEGWSQGFGRDVEHATLKGVTAFCMKDARMAGERLLALGPVRLKPVRASGGRGQILIQDRRQLHQALAHHDEDELLRWGLVLEEHLEEVETFSVGQARVANAQVSYVGTQSLTPSNEGLAVYGGSTLLCVRGGYDELLGLALDESMRRAVRLAREYDAAARRCWPALLASRRNYDVAWGKDARGRSKMGVLEQSWRAGGASFAEACAFDAFQQSAGLSVIWAYTCERYGSHHHAPVDAELIFHGDDSVTGFITKYGGTKSYGNT